MTPGTVVGAKQMCTTIQCTCYINRSGLLLTTLPVACPGCHLHRRAQKAAMTLNQITSSSARSKNWRFLSSCLPLAFHGALKCLAIAPPLPLNLLVKLAVVYTYSAVQVAKGIQIYSDLACEGQKKSLRTTLTSQPRVSKGGGMGGCLEVC